MGRCAISLIKKKSNVVNSLKWCGVACGGNFIVHIFFERIIVVNVSIKRGSSFYLICSYLDGEKSHFIFYLRMVGFGLSTVSEKRMCLLIMPLLRRKCDCSYAVIEKWK